MQGFNAKIRGILSLGIVGGAVGFIGGAIWGFASYMVRSGVFFDPAYLRFLLRMALGNAIGFMLIGSFTAAGFGAVLAVASSAHSIEELSLWRTGLWGGLVSASFPPIFVIWRSGISAYWDSAVDLLPVMGVLAVIGGALTSSLVAMGKRASRADLSASDEPPGRLNAE